MNNDLARTITELADEIDAFCDPPDSVSDRVAERLFAAQENRIARLERLCQQAMRQMILEAARKEATE